MLRSSGGLLVAIAAMFLTAAVATPSSRALSPQALKYWCPMHPDERASSPITCPICKMRMVAIPPMRVGEYRLDILPRPSRANPGLDGLRLTLRDPVSNLPVTSLAIVHEKPLHVFVVGRDLRYFQHVHPTRSGSGAFDLRMPIPPGEYLVVADFLPAAGTAQLIHRIVVSPGPRANVPIRPAASSAVEAGIRIQADVTEMAAERKVTMAVSLTFAEGNSPVRDLEPYLGASAHLLVVSEDLTEAIHGHPDDSALASPLKFVLTLPRPGRYRAWLQFQRGSQVVTAALGLLAR